MPIVKIKKKKKSLKKFPPTFRPSYSLGNLKLDFISSLIQTAVKQSILHCSLLLHSALTVGLNKLKSGFVAKQQETGSTKSPKPIPI